MLFLHGGGYINEIVRAHFIGYLPRHGQTLSFPFIRTPRTAKDIVPATGDLLRPALPPAKVAVVGNSAGADWRGGPMVTDWIPATNGLVLISPVDARSAVRSMATAARDPCRYSGYHRSRAFCWRRMSPIRMSSVERRFRGTGADDRILGTLDLLYPDSIELAAKAGGGVLTTHLRPASHNYAGMPTPEAGRHVRSSRAPLPRDDVMSPQPARDDFLRTVQARHGLSAAVGRTSLPGERRRPKARP